MMKHSIVSVAAALSFLSVAAPASAEQTPSQGASSSMAGHSDIAAGRGVPEQYRAASANMPQGQGMGDMPGMSMQGMTDASKAYMEAMMKMHSPMMTATQAKDPDMAFICRDAPPPPGCDRHGPGRAQVGDNPEAKRMAEKVIKDQGEEIEKMTAWLKRTPRRKDSNPPPVCGNVRDGPPGSGETQSRGGGELRMRGDETLSAGRCADISAPHARPCSGLPISRSRAKDAAHEESLPHGRCGKRGWCEALFETQRRSADEQDRARRCRARRASGGRPHHRLRAH